MYYIFLRTNYLLDNSKEISDENLETIKLANAKELNFILISNQKINQQIIEKANEIKAKFIFFELEKSIYDLETNKFVFEITSDLIFDQLNNFIKSNLLDNQKIITMALGFKPEDLALLNNVDFAYLIANDAISLKKNNFLNTCSLDQDGLSYAIKDFLYHNNLI